MLKLYVIRHGLAGRSLEGEEDDARPLTKKGKEKMKEVAKRMKEWNIHFDLILTSPLVRAQDSAEILKKSCGGDAEIVTTDLLKPGFSYPNLIKHLNELKDVERVAIVGHEPVLSGFVSYCLTKSKNSVINLKKGGALMLEIDEVIKPGQCVLSWLMQPKQIVSEKA